MDVDAGGHVMRGRGNSRYSVPWLVLAAGLASGPVFAEIDLSGEWGPRYHEDQPERLPGPAIGEYHGLPINDAARLRAESWDPSLLTLLEHQCKPHPADYATRGPSNLRIWKDIDTATQQIMAIKTHIQWQAPERTIWMDGRPHPPEYAAHTWQGFSTGQWEGDTLTVKTTHLKAGWIRRNGVLRTDKATLTEHYIRHGNYLTIISIVDDPIYLTEPIIRSQNWVLDLNQQINPYPCHISVEIDRPQGTVPHFLPGENPFLDEYPSRYDLPVEGTRGGAATMYPDFIE